MHRLLIVLGLIVVLAGVLWPWLSRLPLGRLPGDIMIQRPGFRFYFPLATCILISVVISVIVRLFRR